MKHLNQVLVSFESPENSAFMRNAVAQVDKWIKNKGYLLPDISMSKLCEMLSISRYELSWVCKHFYGDNFPSVRKRMRIFEAEKMLAENPDIPFTYIGERVGIPDRTNFRRQFFEVTGQTPTEYKQGLKK